MLGPPVLGILANLNASTQSVLGSLAVFTFTTSFHRSPFADMLPPGSSFFSHPIRFLGTYLEVYRLHTARISAETAERRKRKVEDVQKRSYYRKKHGLEDAVDSGEVVGAGGGKLGGWTAKRTGEEIGPALVTPDNVDGAVGKEVGLAGAIGGASDESLRSGAEEKSSYVDFEGRKRPIKKWLGIW